jgi:hypothetical protein
MSTKTLIALATAAAATLFTTAPALAQEATSDAWMNVQSTQTRAQVVAALQQAQARGELKPYATGYIEPGRSQLLRATVKAETLRALASGELKSLNAEAYNFQPQSQAPVRTADTKAKDSAQQ